MKLFSSCGAGAGEIDHRAALLLVEADRDLDDRAVIHRVGELAVLQHVDHAAHRFLGIVLHVAHVGVHDVEAEMRDHAAQFLHAFFVGGDHRAQVGHVLRDVAARIFAGGEQRDGFLLAQAALLDQQEVVDQHAFFLDHAAVGRHRARRDAADVGVVAA